MLVRALDCKNFLYQIIKAKKSCYRKDMMLKVKARAKPNGGSNYQH